MSITDAQALRRPLALGQRPGPAAANQTERELMDRFLRLSDLCRALDPRAHEAVAALENLCDQRRQFDHQAKLHCRLHNWLWVHLPLSLALIILMFVHIYKTLQYWWPG